MSHPLRAIAVVTALGLVAVTVWTIRDHGDQPEQPQRPVSLGRTAPVALTTVHDCADLLKYYKTEADRIVGPYGLNGGPIYPMAMSSTSGVTPKAASGASNAATAVSGAAPVPDSTTNVQVAGVDESDVVKTSGSLMVSAVDGAVQITRLAGRQTRTLATWHPAGGWAQSVILDDDTGSTGAAGTDAKIAVILENSNSGLQPMNGVGMTRFMGPAISGTTRLTVLDLSNPSHPRPIRRLDINGSISGAARLVDGELRFAVTADTNGLTWKPPIYSSAPMSVAQSRRAEKRATAANRTVIGKSTIANWLPQATVTPLNAAGKPNGPATRRPLLDCAQVAIPASFSGLQTLAMISVDLRTGTPLADWRAAGVVAAGSTLYATADHAWLTTSRWDRPTASGSGTAADSFVPTPGSTEIHLFDTPLRAEPRYVASGEIDGTLLDQYSMDERSGLLRVASTTEAEWTKVIPQPMSKASALSAGPVAGPQPMSKASAPSIDPVPPPQPAKPSEGRISVLRVDGDRLVRVGVLTGLGVGEQIRGVRFDGDVGYVVTYRQTDPLYTVDLSNPLRPRLRGTLKLAGYSAYLHPTGPGRVLGLGQDGTAAGQVTGLQLALFDVSDLSAPRRLDRQMLAGAWSDAEADQHAFTMAGNLALIPYTSWSVSPATSKRPAAKRFDAGVMAVRVSADRVGTPVVLRPLASGPVTLNDLTGAVGSRLQRVLQATPTRTVVHAGLIYTLTPVGVAVHDATDFTRLTFARF